MAAGPALYVDSPLPRELAAGQLQQVSGWGIDTRDRTGVPSTVGPCGFEGVHIWAYPLTGEPPTLFGSSPLVFYRPDLLAAFGTTYRSCGFAAYRTQSTALPAGSYDFVFYALSRITNAFDTVRVVRIVVR